MPEPATPGWASQDDDAPVRKQAREFDTKKSGPRCSGKSRGSIRVDEVGNACVVQRCSRGDEFRDE